MMQSEQPSIIRPRRPPKSKADEPSSLLNDTNFVATEGAKNDIITYKFEF